MPPPGQVPLVQKNSKLHPSLVALEVALHPSLSRLLAEVQEFLPLPTQAVCRASSFQFLQIVSCTFQSVSSHHDLHSEGKLECSSNPSLSDVLSPDLWIPSHTVWLGVRWSAHDAIQSVFAVAVTLRQSIDRSAVPDSRESPEQMFICQLSFTNPSSQLPSRFDATRGMSTQLVVYLLNELADATIVGFPKDPPERRATIGFGVVSGDQPSNVSDQPHDCRMFQRQTTTDSSFQSQLVCHKDPTVNLNACFDRSLALMTVRRSVSWQSSMYPGIILTSPAISSPVLHPRATQHQCDPTFPAFVPQRQLSPQKNPSLTALPSQHQ